MLKPHRNTSTPPNRAHSSQNGSASPASRRGRLRSASTPAAITRPHSSHGHQRRANSFGSGSMRCGNSSCSACSGRPSLLRAWRRASARRIGTNASCQRDSGWSANGPRPIEAQPHPWCRRGQTDRFTAIGVATRAPRQLRLQATTQRLVEGVAHRGAIGGVIVVVVARVFRLGPLGQVSGQGTRLVRAQVQPLHAGTAAGLVVVRQVLLQRQRHQVIHHVATCEAADEIVLGGSK